MHELSLQEVIDGINTLKSTLDKTMDASVLIRSFLKFSPASSVMLDKHGNIVLWTKKFQEMFEIDGMNLSDLPIVTLLANHNCSKQDLTTLIYEHKKGSGRCVCGNEVYHYSVNPWPLNGSMGGTIVSFKNITSEIKLIEQIKILAKDKLGGEKLPCEVCVRARVDIGKLLNELDLSLLT